MAGCLKTPGQHLQAVQFGRQGFGLAVQVLQHRGGIADADQQTGQCRLRQLVLRTDLQASLPTTTRIQRLLQLLQHAAEAVVPLGMGRVCSAVIDQICQQGCCLSVLKALREAIPRHHPCTPQPAIMLGSSNFGFP